MSEHPVQKYDVMWIFQDGDRRGNRKYYWAEGQSLSANQISSTYLH